MIQMNSPIAKRNAGPNHEGKFSWAFKKLRAVIAEIKQLSANSNRTRVLKGSDLLSNATFAICIMVGIVGKSKEKYLARGP